MSVTRHICIALFILPMSHLGLIARAEAAAPTTAPTSRPALPKENRGLMRAIRNGDVPQVKTLLDDGASPNSEGDSPLCFAALLGQMDIAKLLLAKGANPDSQNNFGCSSLLCAAHNLRGPMVRLLLDAGAKDGTDAALIYAAYKGESSIVRMLLDAGAKVNFRGDNGETPLWEAAAHGRKDSVQMLLDAGADRSLIGYGTAPEAEARARGHADVADLIANFKQ